mmetsp:Transcript_14845/g.18586  ORF Transcript_14845/g.18586 Transcript_14845/m.18586 type:complete len:238 (-) Transcript_14845:1810-2523(-)
MLALFLLHGHSGEFEFMLAQFKLLLALDQGAGVCLLLLAELLQARLHVMLLTLYTLFLSLLATLSLLLFLLKPCSFFAKFLVHSSALILQLLLLLLIAFFLNALLLGKLAEFDLVKGHVPVDGLRVLHLFLQRVVADHQGLWTPLFHTLKPILLDEGPGKQFLFFARHLGAIVIDVLRCLDQSVELSAQLGVLENVDAASKADSIAVIQHLPTTLHRQRLSIHEGRDSGLTHDRQLK